DLISAHTAELGIELAASHQPELILMDINLPGINGIEALRRLKSRSATQNIPVIAVTAAAMPHQIKEGMQQGFVTYITKPIQVEAFLKTVHDILDPTATDAA
ncbi:MAG TPA: response regulator, partial [Magnetovibrio sp.]